jgi:SAM-dependent methyltransferase
MPNTDNYQGLEASLYDYFWINDDLGDVQFFLDMVKTHGGNCLDLGCGTGRVLLPLAAEGIQIEGVDNSSEMLRLCQLKADIHRVKVTLHEQSMQDLDMGGRKFNTILIPGASFQILTERDDAKQALEKIREHLAPDGQLLLSTYIPWFELSNDVAIGHWRLHKEAIRESDGARVICNTTSELDRHEQLMQVWNRYEVFTAEGKLAETELRDMHLRWYFKNEMTLLLQSCGFDEVVTYGDCQDEDATDGHSVITYRAMA